MLLSQRRLLSDLQRIFKKYDRARAQRFRRQRRRRRRRRGAQIGSRGAVEKSCLPSVYIIVCYVRQLLFTTTGHNFKFFTSTCTRATARDFVEGGGSYGCDHVVPVETRRKAVPIFCPACILNANIIIYNLLLIGGRYRLNLTQDLVKERLHKGDLEVTEDTQ